MDRVLITALLMGWAAPAWANPSNSGPIGMGALVALPILMYLLTRGSGAYEIVRLKGDNRWSAGEIATALVIGLFISAGQGEFGMVILMIVAFVIFLRGLQMAYWGLRAKAAPERRPAHLAGAKSGRLIGSGLFLAAMAAALGLVGAVDDARQSGTMDLVRKSSEGASKGNLGEIRAALSVYHGDAQGRYPKDLTALTVGGKYLKETRRRISIAIPPQSIMGPFRTTPAAGFTTIWRATPTSARCG